MQNYNISCTFNIRFIINIILGNSLFSSAVPQDTRCETTAKNKLGRHLRDDLIGSTVVVLYEIRFGGSLFSMQASRRSVKSQ